MRRYRKVVCAFVLGAVVAGCSQPTQTFLIENTCDEVVAVRVGPANVGGSNFKDVQSGDSLLYQLPSVDGELGFSVFSNLASGSPDTSYTVFDPQDLEPGEDGVYHLTVGPNCEALQP